MRAQVGWTSNDVHAYIEAKGLECKRQVKEYLLRVCPVCGDEKSHFYIKAATGQFYCFKCQISGGFYKLRQLYGDMPAQELNMGTTTYRKPVVKIDAENQALLSDTAAMAYLDARKLSRHAIVKFKLGLHIENGVKWLSMPHLRQDKVICVKYRSLPPAPKEFKRSPDAESILYNCDAIGGKEAVILCEGEVDTLTLLSAGFENAVGLTCGARTFKPEWWDLLKPIKKVFLALDTDLEGEKGAQEIARRLGYDKCYQVKLLKKDVNEFFVAGGNQADFQKLLDKAKPFDIPNTRNYGDFLDEFFRQEEFENVGLIDKIYTPWASVNKKLEGFKPGQLIVLSAPPKMGKTLLALNICAYNIGIGVPCMFYCLEMMPNEILKRFLICHFGKKAWTKLEIDAIRRIFSETPFIAGYRQTGMDVETVIETIRASVQRYGLKFVVLDHLHFVLRGEDLTAKIGQFVQQLKGLALDLGIPLMAIAQPRKTDLERSMHFFDLKWSADIASDADTIICLHRKQTKDEEAETSYNKNTFFRIDAARDVAGGSCRLVFNQDTLSFEEDKNQSKDKEEAPF